MVIMGKIVEKLLSVNIPASPYNTKERIFGLRVRKGEVQVCEGRADVLYLRTNKRKRQVLLTIQEPKRVFTTTFGFSTNLSVNELYENDIDLFHKIIRRRFNSISTALEYYNGLYIPNARFKVMKVDKHSWFQNSCTLTAKIRITVPSTTTQFLIGYDEPNSEIPFICVLKKVVCSFDEAYKELLPKDVRLRKGYKRQGEWFFNPVPKKQQRQLFQHMHKLCQRRLGNTTHMANTIKVGNNTYAIGVVKDDRKNRHKPLLLTEWHSVHRNNERIVRSKKSAITYD